MKQLYTFLFYFFTISFTSTSYAVSCPDPPPVAEYEVQHHDCVSQGTVTVNYPLGSQYEYSISGTVYPGSIPYDSGYQSSPVFENVPQGDFQINVKDEDCTSTTSFFVVHHFYPKISGHYADCSIETGAITVYAPFTAPQFEYSIDGVNYISIPAETNHYVFENLTVGQTYTIYLKDVFNDCVVTRTSTISQILQPVDTPEVIVTQPDCLNPFGSITITSPTSWLLNQFSIDGGQNYQFEPVFENLTEGTYEVMVKRGIQCFSESVEVIIDNLSEIPPTPIVNAYSYSCYSPPDAGGNFIVTSPLGSQYQYSINGTDYQDDPMFLDNVPPGTYQITVKEGDCISEAVEATIQPYEGLPDVTVEVIQPDCTNPYGTITVTSPITFPGGTHSINGTDYQFSPVFENLTPGIYPVTFKNGWESCVTEILEVTIIPPPNVPEAPTADFYSSCIVSPGGSYGTIYITNPLGSQYQYSIDGINYQDNPVFEYIPLGIYQITVKEGDCVSESVTVEPVIADIPVPTVDVVQPDCSNPYGIITVISPVMDSSPYLYSINGIDYQLSNVFENLSSGMYSVTAKHSVNECISDPLEVVLNDIVFDFPEATVEVVQPSSCGGSDGSITVHLDSVFTGDDMYWFSINGIDYQNIPVFENLPAGTYQVTVKVEDCISDPLEVVINSPDVPIPEVTVINPACYDIPEAGGKIIITSPLGSEYQYSIDGINYSASTEFFISYGGTYQVTVKEGDCVSEPLEVVVHSYLYGLVPQATLIPIPCSFIPEDMGTLIVTYPLGDGYQYSIDGVNYQSSPVFPNVWGFGTFELTVRQGDCISEPLEINIDNIEQSSVPEADVTQPDCSDVPETGQFGTITVSFPLGDEFQYSIDGENYQDSPLFFNVPSGSYELTFRIYEYCVSDPLEVSVFALDIPEIPTAIITQPTCDNPFGSIEVTSPLMDFPPYTYSINGEDYQLSPIFENLSPGIYQLTTQLSEGGCPSEPLEVNINFAPTIPETPTINVIQPTCDNPFGSIEVVSPVDDGDEFTPNYEYSINGVDYYEFTLFDNLPSGVYYVTVRHLMSGCVSESIEVIINELSEIYVNLIVVCENENRFLLKAETEENYQYVWNTGETTSEIEINEIGEYSVIVSSDNCSEEFFIDIDAIPCMIPKGISPNGDFKNDDFDLSGFGTVKRVEIFNRYGTSVYSQSNYTNQWKGQSDNGKELPSGTYYYLINFQNGITKTGWVYLNRG